MIIAWTHAFLSLSSDAHGNRRLISGSTMKQSRILHENSFKLQNRYHTLAHVLCREGKLVLQNERSSLRFWAVEFFGVPRVHWLEVGTELVETAGIEWTFAFLHLSSNIHTTTFWPSENTSYPWSTHPVLTKHGYSKAILSRCPWVDVPFWSHIHIVTVRSLICSLCLLGLTDFNGLEELGRSIK